MEAGSGPQLFERNAVERVLRTPAVIEHRRLPAAKRRDADSRGRLFFAYFLLAKQKKVSRPPGRDPAPKLKTIQAPNQCTLKSLSGSVHTAPGRNPAFTASARNPSTVNLCEYSV